MKKHFYLLLASIICYLTIPLSGCSSDNQISDETILGKWELIRMETDDKTVNVEDGEICEYLSNGKIKRYNSDGEFIIQDVYWFEDGFLYIETSLSEDNIFWIKYEYKILKDQLMIKPAGASINVDPYYAWLIHRQIK